MTEVQLPFALNAEGSMVAVADVPNGLACDCKCPACKRPLIAAQGQLVAWHFRHLADDAVCHNGPETAVHLMAKEIIVQTLAVGLPLRDRKACSIGRMLSAEVEATMGGMRFDVLAKHEGGYLAIEIFVKHRVTAEKLAKIKDLGIPAIEVDLSDCPGKLPSREEFADIVCFTAPRKWLLHSPYAYSV